MGVFSSGWFRLEVIEERQRHFTLPGRGLQKSRFWILLDQAFLLPVFTMLMQEVVRVAGPAHLQSGGDPFHGHHGF
jgi:hypothetical protein